MPCAPDPQFADETIATDALVTVLGGNYSPGSPREGSHHSSPLLRRALDDVWGLDLRVAQRRYELVGVNPALDAFTEVAGELKVVAEADAVRPGRGIV